MPRFDESKSTRLTRDELVQLGETMLTVANRQFGTECKAEVTCYTRNWRIGDSSVDAIHGHSSTREEIERENEPITRIKLGRVQDLLPDDLTQDGLIRISIKPIDEKAAPETAWAVLETRGNKKGIETYIQGGEIPANALKPVADVWNKQTKQPAPLAASAQAPSLLQRWRSSRLLGGANMWP